MKHIVLIATCALMLAASSSQATDKKCFQLADDDPRLMSDCPPIKLGQGESRGLFAGDRGLADDGPGNQNQNQNANQNQNQNTNQNQNQNTN